MLQFASQTAHFGVEEVLPGFLRLTDTGHQRLLFAREVKVIEWDHHGKQGWRAVVITASDAAERAGHLIAWPADSLAERVTS
jgi:hypothetical protein